MSHAAHFIAREWRQGNGLRLSTCSPEDSESLTLPATPSAGLPF